MSKEILDSDDINRVIRRMAHEIIEKNKGVSNLCLVGIQKGGVTLAERLASQIEAIEGGKIRVGKLDITLYRDDLNTKEEQPIVKRTEIPCTIASGRFCSTLTGTIVRCGAWFTRTAFINEQICLNFPWMEAIVIWMYI